MKIKGIRRGVMIAVVYIFILLFQYSSPLFSTRNVYACDSTFLKLSNTATLRVSLPEGTTCGPSPDPWLNKGWILYNSGNDWTFTVKVKQRHIWRQCLDTYLVIALNYEAYEKLVSLSVNGSDISKNSFVYGTPEPYGVWTWPDDVYPTWFNDTLVNLGTIYPRKAKNVVIHAVFSSHQNVRMHFDAYGKKSICSPKWRCNIFWSPNSKDSTVLSMIEPPVAEFTYSPLIPVAGELVTFNATSSYAPNGYITNYTWNFGDGTPEVTETDPIIYHSFALSGNYLVTLNVTDNLGLTDSTSKTITVYGNPTATFVFTPEYPIVGETVTFNASGSSPNGGTIVSYSWDFESDGVIDSYGVTATHVYDQPGNYTVTLNVTDSEGLSDIESKVVHVRKPPIASFTYSPANPLVGEAVTFDASASVPNGGSIVSYAWDFGDGCTNTTANPTITHTYFAYGNYTVTLNITDSEGLWNAKSKSIRIFIPSVASFTYSPSVPIAGEMVIFNASNSIDPDGLIVSYKWNFGDGNVMVTIYPVIIHVFATSGSYLVNLTVVDNDGLKDSTATTLYVKDYPYASFTYSPANPLVGEAVTFDASASVPNGGSIVSYAWDFGDGCTNTTANPTITHTYFAYGTYLVTLNVTDSEGLWDLANSTIQVRDYPTANFTISPKPPYFTSTVLTFNASSSTANGGILIEYSWDFESDGVIDSYGEMVTHTYSTYGIYNVTLRVTDSEGLSDGASQTVRVLVPPVAEFTYSPETAVANEIVFFDASLSYDPDGTIVSYAWDFGDGNVGNGAITQHTYTTFGNFTVTLTVTDNDNLSDSIAYAITVIARPTAFFIYSPTYPETNETVTFDASGSKPNGGNIVDYTWDFGDGNVITTTGLIVTYTYTTAGNYTVMLNVTDSEGMWDAVTQLVLVSYPEAFVDSTSYTAHMLGEVFEINVDIENAPNLYGFEFKLGYDTTLLDAVKVEEGPFLKSFGNTFVAKQEINDTEGYVWIAVTLIAPAPPAEGNGTLAIITFNATYASVWPETVGCPLHLYDTKLSDHSAQPISHTVSDGWYEFVPPPPPQVMPVIDIYTQRDGKGPYVPSGGFFVGETVELYALVTYNNESIQSKLVAFWVFDPKGTIVLSRIAQTNTTGIATINFTIMEPCGWIGMWSATAVVSVAEEVISDTVLFMVRSDRIIDVYTEIDRWPGYNTPFTGKDPHVAADAFAPQENVTIYAEVTYNCDPVCNKLVAFEIHGPVNPINNISLTRTAYTNASGIATVTFRIPWPCEDSETVIFGMWSVYADVDIAEMMVNDTVWFQVGWIVNILEIELVTSTGAPNSKVAKGEYAYFNVTLQNIGMISRYALFTVIIYDDLGVPIGYVVFSHNVPQAGEEYFNFMTEIPKWAFIGEGTAYTNCYTGIPSQCGVPYCPEAFTNFAVTS